MFRLLTLAMAFSGLVMPLPAIAAEKKPNTPAVIIKAQSIDDIMANVEYVGASIGFEEEAKQAVGFVKGLRDPKKGIEGVDTKRPFVIYASIAQNLPDSPVVAIIPIADQESFLSLLKDRAGAEVTEVKDDKGLYSVSAPMLPEKVFLRFANDYAYATLKNSDNIALKGLPEPKELIGNMKGMLSVSVMLESIPEDMRKTLLGQIEMKLAEGKDMPLPNETPATKALKDKFIDSISEGLKAALLEGKEFNFALDINPNRDEIGLEIEMTAMKGTTLAKEFASIKDHKSVIAGALAGKTAIMLGANLSLPEQVKKALPASVDEAMKKGLENVPDEYKKIAEKLMTAFAPTIKAGDLDFSAALVGPTSDNMYTFVMGGKVVKGTDIEKAIKESVKMLPDQFQEFVGFDAEDVGSVKIHQLKVKDFLPPEVKKVIGENDVWLAFRDDLMVVVAGPEYKSVLKAILTSKPAKAPMGKFELAITKLIPLMEAAPEAEKLKKLAEETFGKKSTGDTIYAIAEGGDSLKLRIAIKGKALKFIVTAAKEGMAGKKGE